MEGGGGMGGNNNGQLGIEEKKCLRKLLKKCNKICPSFAKNIKYDEKSGRIFNGTQHHPFIHFTIPDCYSTQFKHLPIFKIFHR
jgi:hypothetical protein